MRLISQTAANNPRKASPGTGRHAQSRWRSLAGVSPQPGYVACCFARSRERPQRGLLAAMHQVLLTVPQFPHDFDDRRHDLVVDVMLRVIVSFPHELRELGFFGNGFPRLRDDEFKHRADPDVLAPLDGL